MDFYLLLDFLTWLSPFILLAGTIRGIFYYKVLSPVYKSLVYYLLAMACIDLGSRWCGLVYENNLLFIPVLGFVEIFMFSLVYYFIGFKEVPKLAYFLAVVNIAAFAFSIVEIFKIASFIATGFQVYSKAANSFFIILFAVIFFADNIRKNISPPKDIFILNSGILAFFSLNIIIFLPLDFLISEDSIFNFYIWFANLGVTVLFYLFLIYSIWKNGRIRSF